MTASALKVGFVTTPLTSGDAFRGVGFYTQRLLSSLKSHASSHNVEIVEISQSDQGVKLGSVDLIHYPFFSLFFRTLPLVPPAKTVVTVHDVVPLEFPAHYPPGIKGWLNLQYQKLALSRAQGVIADSQTSAKSVHRLLGIPEAKIWTVYLAADDQFVPVKDNRTLSAVKKKYRLPGKFVLYVGDINWNKNLPGLIKACEYIKYPLVIVGKQALEVEGMHLGHPELRHLQDVDWGQTLRLGFVPDADLVAIYNLATVHCQPSFAEGFGLAVLEALACGTPVAASRTPALLEIGGSAVAYFDPTDISSMVEAIGRAPQISGRREQAAKFSWDTTAEQTLQVYRQLIAGRKLD